MDVIELMLLSLLLVCGIATCLSRNLLVSLVIFMAYSVMMSIVWVLLEAPTWPSPKPPWARVCPACCCFSP